MYLIPWYSDMACIHYSSVGRHSVVVSLIWLACTITVFFSPFSFFCFVEVCPWCIFTGISFAFIYASFSANTRAMMPYFTGITIARLIATSWLRLEICSTIFCLSSKALRTSCKLIGLYIPYEMFLLPIHMPKALLKNSSCEPDTEIYGPGPSKGYNGRPNIFLYIGLKKLFTMSPFEFP